MYQMKAWLYVRTFADEMKIVAQENRLSQLLAKTNWRKIGISKEYSGLGYMSCECMEELFQLARNGVYQVLLIESISRVSTDKDNQYSFLKQMDKEGVMVYSLLEGQLTIGETYEI